MYTIMIDEAQRLLIGELLKSVQGKKSIEEHLGLYFEPSNERDSILYLTDMFEELPEQERKAISEGHKPGTTVHGFCL